MTSEGRKREFGVEPVDEGDHRRLDVVLVAGFVQCKPVVIVVSSWTGVRKKGLLWDPRKGM